jgi:magnesium-transporting ATPase (P-type)
MDRELGKWIIVAGLFIAVIGIIIYFFHDKLNWIGHLPGDIRIERENFRFYFPVTTMILASLVLSLLVYIIKRLFL